MVKLQDNRGQFKLTLPKDIVKLMGWKGGTEIVFIQDHNGNLVLKELKALKSAKADSLNRDSDWRAKSAKADFSMAPPTRRASLAELKHKKS